MNWGIIITDALVLIIGTMFTYVWGAYIRPWLEDHHLSEVARIVVSAAQAAYGAGHGEQKLQYAIGLINDKYKITVDSDRICAAIEDAWNTMNISQVAAGIKNVENNV